MMRQGTPKRSSLGMIMYQGLERPDFATYYISGILYAISDKMARSINGLQYSVRPGTGKIKNWIRNILDCFDINNQVGRHLAHDSKSKPSPVKQLSTGASLELPIAHILKSLNVRRRNPNCTVFANQRSAFTPSSSSIATPVFFECSTCGSVSLPEVYGGLHQSFGSPPGTHKPSLQK